MKYSKRFRGAKRWTIWVSIWVVAAALGLPAVAQTSVEVGPRLEVIPGMRARASADGKAQVTHKTSYDLTLKDDQWLDTGVTVGAGEEAQITASGTFTLADGRVAGPEGVERGWKDLLRAFPLNSAKAGALIGRVSDVVASVPFSVGASGEVTMPTNGRLFLRVNVSSDLEATGSFKVKLKFVAASVKAVSDAVVGVTELVSPETFESIPRRVGDLAGNPGDMVNYALVGTEAQVKAAFKAAGWVEVDKNVQDAVLHGILSTLSHEAYTEMPMSTLYLFGRAQDLSYARGDPLKVAAERHHLRVWRSTVSVGGRALWVGSCTHDIGFEKDQRNGNVTHKIDPKVDDERDYLLQSFDSTGAFTSAAYVTPESPMLTARTATGGSFYSDGRILVMVLR